MASRMTRLPAAKVTGRVSRVRNVCRVACGALAHSTGALALVMLVVAPSQGQARERWTVLTIGPGAYPYAIAASRDAAAWYVGFAEHDGGGIWVGQIGSAEASRLCTVPEMAYARDLGWSRGRLYWVEQYTEPPPGLNRSGVAKIRSADRTGRMGVTLPTTGSVGNLVCSPTAIAWTEARTSRGPWAVELGSGPDTEPVGVTALEPDIVVSARMVAWAERTDARQLTVQLLDGSTRPVGEPIAVESAPLDNGTYVSGSLTVDGGDIAWQVKDAKGRRRYCIWSVGVGRTTYLDAGASGEPSGLEWEDDSILENMSRPVLAGNRAYWREWSHADCRLVTRSSSDGTPTVLATCASPKYIALVAASKQRVAWITESKQQGEFDDESKQPVVWSWHEGDSAVDRVASPWEESPPSSAVTALAVADDALVYGAQVVAVAHRAAVARQSSRGGALAAAACWTLPLLVGLIAAAIMLLRRVRNG